MANTLWPEGDALGQCLMVGSDAEACTTVVGVAEDAAHSGYTDEPFMAYYVPLLQMQEPPRAFYARSAGDADEVLAGVAIAARTAAPGIRFANARTMREMMDPQARAWTLGATMFSVFGLLAMVLAAVGLYSVLAFDVAQRTREIGIRSALGAARGRILGSVVVRGARMAALGILVGGSVAFLAAPYARDLLFEVSPKDPLVYAGVALTLLIVGGLASLAPGLRATRVDPIQALRAE
jgi:ABC-type antimicrobial peptide transport system permease subunit